MNIELGRFAAIQLQKADETGRQKQNLFFFIAVNPYQITTYVHFSNGGFEGGTSWVVYNTSTKADKTFGFAL